MVIRLDKFDNKSCIGHVAASVAILSGHVPSAVGQMIDHASWGQRACLDTSRKRIHATSGPGGGTSLASGCKARLTQRAPAAGEETAVLKEAAAAALTTPAIGSGNSRSAWLGWHLPPRPAEFWGRADEAICLELRSTY